jgi:hypothetical protein
MILKKPSRFSEKIMLKNVFPEPRTDQNIRAATAS